MLSKVPNFFSSFEVPDNQLLAVTERLLSAIAKQNAAAKPRGFRSCGEEACFQKANRHSLNFVGALCGGTIMGTSYVGHS